MFDILRCWLAVLSFAAPQLVRGEDGVPVRVTFRLHAPTVPEGADVYITGSLKELGGWQPDAVKMRARPDDRWEFAVTASPGTTIEYKYTLGSWSREGADAEGKPFSNFELKAERSQIQSDRIDRWTDRGRRKPSGQVTGILKMHRRIAFEDLKERDVVVWLPPDYDSDGDTRYPVLYMHDGQNLFDPATSAFGVDWQVDETCTELIKDKQIPALIVVGIGNTTDRSQEYMDTEKGLTYRRFIIESLKPMIDQRYRTRTGRDHTYVGGSSAGGLCALILAWEHAETFSRALCLSPAFRYDREDGTRTIDYVGKLSSQKKPAADSDQASMRVYIDNGGKGVDRLLQPGVDAMREALEAKGIQNGEQLRVVIAPDDPHNEAAWAKRLPEALKWFLE